MKYLTQLGRTILFASLLSVSSAASTAVLTVNAGTTAIFNFDFVAAGATPAPPYTFNQVTTQMLNFDPAVDFGTWTWYPELDGNGAVPIPQFDHHDLAVGGFGGGSTAGYADGIYSLVVEVTAGSITVDPFALGSAGGQSARISPTATVVQAPEPGTVALFAIAVAGLGFAQRRRIAN
jgi:hypothetical protein